MIQTDKESNESLQSLKLFNSDITQAVADALTFGGGGVEALMKAKAYT